MVILINVVEFSCRGNGHVIEIGMSLKSHVVELKSR